MKIQNIDLATPSTMASTYLIMLVCAAASGGRKARGVLGFRTGKPITGSKDAIVEVRGSATSDLSGGRRPFSPFRFYGMYINHRPFVPYQIRLRKGEYISPEGGYSNANVSSLVMHLTPLLASTGYSRVLLVHIRSHSVELLIGKCTS